MRSDLYDAGFAKSADVGEGIITAPVWNDPLVVALPARHPLLIHKHIPLGEVLSYPLVLLCQPDVYEGSSQQIERILRSVGHQPTIAERVTSHDLFLTLVAAGYGLGLTSATRIEVYRHADVVTRPPAGRSLVLMTYLLRSDTEPSVQLSHLIARVHPIEMPVPGDSS